MLPLTNRRRLVANFTLTTVITNAVYKNDTETLQRLQLRVQNHGDLPPAISSSPTAPSYKPASSSTNGYANGYSAPASYAPYQQPSMPARTHPMPICTCWT